MLIREDIVMVEPNTNNTDTAPNFKSEIAELEREKNNKSAHLNLNLNRDGVLLLKLTQ
jgi:hypothetical protein